MDEQAEAAPPASPPAATPSSSSSSSPSSPSAVHTYHCLCTHLILATTAPLSALARRRGLDKAHMLPLPPTPVPDDDASAGNYALLVGTVPERKPQIVRREDGYEKRYVQRCGRCRLVVGYQLDWSQYEDIREEDGTVRSGKREDVVYLLPGGLLDTEEMMAGRDMRKEIDIV